MARARTGSDSREAVIGRATRVKGRISGDGDLLVEGSVEGDISVRGDVTIAEGARGSSNVEAQAVTIRGELEGDVRASGGVHIEAGARVRGDLRGDSIAIDEGAEYVGRLEADFELPAELGGGGGGGRRR
jgi:cytoskeletal protein CcmA (bactofilin family)